MLFQLNEYVFEGEFTTTALNRARSNNLMKYELLNGGILIKKNGTSNDTVQMTFDLWDINNGLTAKEQYKILESLNNSTEPIYFFDNEDNLLGLYFISNFSDSTKVWTNNSPLDFQITLSLERTI